MFSLWLSTDAGPAVWSVEYVVFEEDAGMKLCVHCCRRCKLLQSTYRNSMSCSKSSFTRAATASSDNTFQAVRAIPLATWIVISWFCCVFAAAANSAECRAPPGGVSTWNVPWNEGHTYETFPVNDQLVGRATEGKPEGLTHVCAIRSIVNVVQVALVRLVERHHGVGED